MILQINIGFLFLVSIGINNLIDIFELYFNILNSLNSLDEREVSCRSIDLLLTVFLNILNIFININGTSIFCSKSSNQSFG